MKYFIFILGLLLCLAYESYAEEVRVYADELLTELMDLPEPVSERELKKMAGRYELERMKIHEKSNYDEIVFDPINTRKFSDEFFSYGGNRTKFLINPKKTYLEINQKNVCTFQWELKMNFAKASGVKRRNFSFPIARTGSEKAVGCFRQDRTVDSPGKLMPYGIRKFTKLSGSTLVLTAKYDDMEQVLYYRKVYSDEGQRVSLR